MIIFLPPKDFKLPKMAFEYSIASPVKWAFDISFIPRGVAYPVPFITSSRDGSNFPGEKMSALLLSIPQWDSFY